MASGRTSEVSKVALALAGSIALHIVVAIWLGHAAKVRASEPNKPVTVSVVEIAANMPHMEAKSLPPCCKSTVRLSQP